MVTLTYQTDSLLAPYWSLLSHKTWNFSPLRFGLSSIFVAKIYSRLTVFRYIDLLKKIFYSTYCHFSRVYLKKVELYIKKHNIVREKIVYISLKIKSDYWLPYLAWRQAQSFAQASNCNPEES